MSIKTFIEKIRRVKTRNELVNKFINGKYYLYVIIYETTEIKFSEGTKIEEYYVNREYYSAAHKDRYYYSYDPEWLPRRYSIKEVRKIVKRYIDSAKKYEFDDRYLTHNIKKNNTNIIHIIKKEKNMNINKVKYVLVGDYISPVVISDDDEVLNKLSLEERADIYTECAYYERLVQDIKNEKKDWLFELCNYDLDVINDIYSDIKKYENFGPNTYYGFVKKMLNDKKNITNNDKTSDLNKKRYVTTRDNLVNNFINGNYSLEVISKSFDDVTKTTHMNKIEHYAVDTYTHEYYDVYDTNVPQQRYTVEEFHKIISEKIDHANNYEFDGSYLIYSDNKVILTLYV